MVGLESNMKVDRGAHGRVTQLTHYAGTAFHARLNHMSSRCSEKNRGGWPRQGWGAQKVSGSVFVRQAGVYDTMS